MNWGGEGGFLIMTHFGLVGPPELFLSLYYSSVPVSHVRFAVVSAPSAGAWLSHDALLFCHSLKRLKGEISSTWFDPTDYPPYANTADIFSSDNAVANMNQNHDLIHLTVQPCCKKIMLRT